MNAKPIIDKKQVRANIDRAMRLKVEGADFLLNRVLEDVEDRLTVTNRTFDRVLVVSPYGELISTRMRECAALKEASLVLADSEALDREVLDVELGAADLILDILHLHQVNDVPGMLVQYRRALKPDGLLLSCVPGGDTLSELRKALGEAEEQLSGGVHPRVLPFMDVRDAGGLLQRTGFALPVTDIDRAVVRYDNLFDLMLDQRAMGATNTLIDRTQQLSRRAIFQRAAEIYADQFSDHDGRVRATFSFVWMSGWAPDESQPKALRPGSAKQSLASVLSDKAPG